MMRYVRFLGVLFLLLGATSILGQSLMMRAPKTTTVSVGPSNTRFSMPSYSPRGLNQELYMQHLQNSNVSVVFGLGPAGTGKTLFACYQAVQELKRGTVQKIVLTRPMVSVEEELGFLPGNMVAKMAPWTRPIFDILLEFYPQKDIDLMVQGGVIEISPLAFMRGRTFHRSFIIADEMQNSSPNQMLMMLTRLGRKSKMVITGDLKQSDRMLDNGLLDFLERYHPGVDPSIQLVQMNGSDVQRNVVVAHILDLYNLQKSKKSESSKIYDLTKNDSAKPNSISRKIETDCALIPNDPFLR
jgi:phosphate starvation-inducible PhoH-like protein